LSYQAGELVVEPLDEGDHVLDAGERRRRHLLDQEPDQVALPLHVRSDLQYSTTKILYQFVERRKSNSNG
jgi:hypothetical protein